MNVVGESLCYSKVYSFLLFWFSLMSLMIGVWSYFYNFIMFIEWEMFMLYSVSVVYLILLDWMSMLFISVVMFISSMVLAYSGAYMELDKNLKRFILLVFLFVVSMMLMVMSPNMISILLGWDGLGLVSYALVIYYQNSKSASAGMVTVLSNRVGDVAILISISWMFNFGVWDFFYFQFLFVEGYMKYILFLVILAAMTKSAQIPFSAWLPAAMAAPTPVSSLVHSSTLVTAGVYLLIRFNEALGVNLILTTISICTVFMSGLGANYEFDLKKIIALSTLSQLGVMMMILSVGMFELAFFHLISHAMFKSLLFLCAGSYIHMLIEVQDIRSMNKTLYILPLTSVYFIGCSFSLCGFPFLAGFYSKDLILESYFFIEMNFWLFMMLLMGTFFTILYSVRLFYYLFIKSAKVSAVVHIETQVLMMVPMSMLFIVSLMVGSFFNWMFIFPVNLSMPWYMKNFIFMVGSLMGVLSMFFFFLQNMKKNIFNFTQLNFFFGQMLFLPILTSVNFIIFLSLGKLCFKWLDKGWLEIMGGQGGIKYFMKMALVNDKINVIYMKMYLMVMMVLLLSFILVN